MNVPTFEEIIREAHRLLGQTEEVLRRAWRGEGPTETQIDTLDDVRGQLAVTKSALSRMARDVASETHDAPPASLQRPIFEAPATHASAPPPARRVRKRGAR